MQLPSQFGVLVRHLLMIIAVIFNMLKKLLICQIITAKIVLLSEHLKFTKQPLIKRLVFLSEWSDKK